MKIELNQDEMNTRFSMREKVGIWILLIILRMILIPKYEHQLDRALKPIKDALGFDS